MEGVEKVSHPTRAGGRATATGSFFRKREERKWRCRAGFVSAKLGPRFILGHFSALSCHLLGKISSESAGVRGGPLVFASCLLGRGLSCVEFGVGNGLFALGRTSHVDSGAEN